MTLADATVLFRWDNGSLSITGWGIALVVFIAIVLAPTSGK